MNEQQHVLKYIEFYLKYLTDAEVAYLLMHLYSEIFFKSNNLTKVSNGDGECDFDQDGSSFDFSLSFYLTADEKYIVDIDASISGYMTGATPATREDPPDYGTPTVDEITIEAIFVSTHNDDAIEVDNKLIKSENLKDLSFVNLDYLATECVEHLLDADYSPSYISSFKANQSKNRGLIPDYLFKKIAEIQETHEKEFKAAELGKTYNI